MRFTCPPIIKWSAIFFVFVILIAVLLPPRDCAESDEEQFVKHFGNDPNNTLYCPILKKCFDESKEFQLEKLLAGAHRKLPTFDFNLQTHSFTLKKAVLKFKSPMYLPMRVEIIGYGIRPMPGAIPKNAQKSIKFKEDDRWYITQGVKKDCLFYLTLSDASKQEFYIDKQICGVKTKF